ncbi:MAG: NADPH2:quinone reductase [Kiritimatiellia bacterium]|jgi:NADPH2:quinone reductase
MDYALQESGLCEMNSCRFVICVNPELTRVDMKAVAYRIPGPIERDDALQDITLDTPKAEGRDLLVKICAVSVNPVDTKLRRAVAPEGDAWKVLGFDASGVVEAVGPDAQNFKPGDAVFYAGSLTRPGTNSEFHLVDERIVGRKPCNVNHAEAAALPLTAITAWEMLFDRLDVKRPTPQGADTILIIGGAGGVGSITIQLLRALTEMTVVATASRPETQDWVRECGAHHVIDHSQPLASQVEALGRGAPGFVFSTTQTHRHMADIVELIAPQGRFGLIDDPEALNVMPLKRKSISLHWELMFTRTLFGTPDIEEQGKLLNDVADLVEAGRIHSTATDVAGKIDAKTLRAVHAQIESGTSRGKIVLEGF